MIRRLTHKEVLWRTGEQIAALKQRGGVTADLFHQDLDEIERRMLQGLLDPYDESTVEIAYWMAFGKNFEA